MSDARDSGVSWDSLGYTERQWLRRSVLRPLLTALACGAPVAEDDRSCPVPEGTTTPLAAMTAVALRCVAARRQAAHGLREQKRAVDAQRRHEALARVLLCSPGQPRLRFKPGEPRVPVVVQRIEATRAGRIRLRVASARAPDEPHTLTYRARGPRGFVLQQPLAPDADNVEALATPDALLRPMDGPVPSLRMLAATALARAWPDYDAASQRMITETLF